MATRRRKATEESAPEEVATATPEIQEEETPMADVTVDEVVEDETNEAPRRGRKADPFTAATKRLTEARKNVKLARSVPPLDAAEAELAEATAELQALMASEV